MTESMTENRKTEKLFYQDSHLKEFEARVTACEKNGEHFETELDRTAFSRKGEVSMPIRGSLAERVCWTCRNGMGTSFISQTDL